jgi:hypothetical protein
MPPVWTRAAAPRPSRKGGSLAHRHFAGEVEKGGQTGRGAVGVGRGDGVAIDGGACKFRQILRRDQLLRQHAIQRVGGGDRAVRTCGWKCSTKRAQAAGGVWTVKSSVIDQSPEKGRGEGGATVAATLSHPQITQIS